ncbi:ABC transporter permease [Crateriforma spongiae]|uniref:ABC transporter permease n=1 Tax=Crateriforma spongiae TaxID=2724528 RepID=UPI0014474F04|nr:ABC transporter permease [Crateriforma spongiae]
MWPTKNIGIFLLLLAIMVIASLINGSFVDPANLKTLIRDTSLYGLISLGVAVVIITGGIDLSIGSMIALCGVMLVQVVNVHYEPTDFTASVSQVVRQGSELAATLGPSDESDLSLIRLSTMPDTVNEGDRLVYSGVTGQSFVSLAGIHQTDGTTFLTTRDTARSLSVGTQVQLETIAYTPPLLACSLVLGFAGLLGCIHGILVTWLRLQPFVVTLCGLLIYRGAARVWTGDDQIGLQNALPGFKAAITGTAFQFPLPLIGRISGATDDWSAWVWVDFPVTGVLLVLVGIVGWVLLNRTVWGRHLLATGQNETAARYSGVSTDRLVIAAYVVCSLLAGLAGILFTLEWNSVQPGSSGNFYELYAIAAAVLGGCSLRGGQGAVLGVIAGAAVMRCLYKAIVVLGIPQEWEMVIIGMALLCSVIVDEVLRRLGGKTSKAG